MSKRINNSDELNEKAKRLDKLINTEITLINIEIIFLFCIATAATVIAIVTMGI